MSQMRSYRSEQRAGIVRRPDQAAAARPSFKLVLLPGNLRCHHVEPDLFLPTPKEI